MDNPCAFPAGWPEAGYEPHYGMTLRDWFAGQALGSAWATAMEFSRSPETPEHFAARQAYAIADAMLAERAKETDNAHD